MNGLYAFVEWIYQHSLTTNLLILFRGNLSLGQKFRYNTLQCLKLFISLWPTQTLSKSRPMFRIDKLSYHRKSTFIFGNYNTSTKIRSHKQSSSLVIILTFQKLAEVPPVRSKPRTVLSRSPSNTPPLPVIICKNTLPL